MDRISTKHMKMIRMPQPIMAFNGIDDDITVKVAAKIVDMTEDAIVSACVNFARDVGVTDLYLSDKTFLLEAIQDKMNHNTIDIIRCKNCEHQKTCKHTRRLGINGYCSEGERRSD